MSTNNDTVIIFDTTLRDGEQSPGCSMNTDEKIEVAKALVELGVDIIEAGFPIASPGDFEAVQRIARECGAQTTICGLARSRKMTSTALVTHWWMPRKNEFMSFGNQFHSSRTQIGNGQTTDCRHGSRNGLSCKRVLRGHRIFSRGCRPDRTRFSLRSGRETIAAGATTVNIPDTVGYATPSHYHHVISTLKRAVPNIDQAIISTHCHNDLGLAVANSLSAVEAGARQVECTINGLGETCRERRFGRSGDGSSHTSRLLRHQYQHQHSTVASRKSTGFTHHGDEGST